MQRVYLLVFTILSVICYSCQGQITKNSTDRVSMQLPKMPEEAHLVFVGDIMTHGPQIKAAYLPNGSYCFDSCFVEVAPIIRDANLAIGNLETTLAGKPYTGYPTFSSPDELLKSLKRIGFDILTTANNHCNDKGARGIIRTIQQLEKDSIASTGTYCDSLDSCKRGYIVRTIHGIKIGLMALTYGTNGLHIHFPTKVDLIDTLSLKHKIQQMRFVAKVDYLIVSIHWGIEYTKNPTQSQIKLAHWLHKQGVDAIIGSHPHVVQRSTFIVDSLSPHPTFCIYSMGNFISNQNTPIATRGGMILHLTLKRDSTSKIIQTLPSYQFVWVEKSDRLGNKIYKLIPNNLNVEAIRSQLTTTDLIPFERFAHYYKSITFVK